MAKKVISMGSKGFQGVLMKGVLDVNKKVVPTGSNVYQIVQIHSKLPDVRGQKVISSGSKGFQGDPLVTRGSKWFQGVLMKGVTRCE